MPKAEKFAEAPVRLYRGLLRLFEKYYWVFFAAACLTLAFFCFRCLDVQYVDSWDEARHGVNAYEMIQNGDYIRHTYNYQTDDWNLPSATGESFWASACLVTACWGSALPPHWPICSQELPAPYSRSGTAERPRSWSWAFSVPTSARFPPILPGQVTRTPFICCFSPWQFLRCCGSGKTIKGCTSAACCSPWLF